MVEEIELECVKPTEEDIRLIMQWRKDPMTLAMSFDIQEPKWESYFPQFKERFFRLAGLPPLFALHQGKRIAFIGFTPFNNPAHTWSRSCEISINVAPDFRNKGLGTDILRTINPWVKEQGFDEIIAEIKAENIASQKAFTKAGYHFQTTLEKEIPETGEVIKIQRFELLLNPDIKAPPHHVYVIAEAGSNWRLGSPERDLLMAKNMIVAAKEAGADAVKFQTFRPHTVYVKNAGTSDYLSQAGIKQDIQQIFADLAMPYEMLSELATYSREVGIDFLSSFFSIDDFKAIDPFVSMHKIASYEISHPHLIQLAAKSGKPLILSTGAARESDIQWAVDYFHSCGGVDITLLQCTAQYPADPRAMNLKAITWLKKRFRVPVGLSDHSRDPLCAPIMAVALGATVIEKHFTLSNKLPGPDHFFAVTPLELKSMIESVRLATLMRGTGIKEVQTEEEELYQYARRGVQAIRDIKQGESLKEGDNFSILRPGNQLLGMHPRYLTMMKGKKTKRAIPSGRGIQLSDVE